MPLQTALLAQHIARLGDASIPGFLGPGTLLQAPGRLASAFDAYAKNAADAGGNRLVSGNIAAMQAALASVFAVPAQTPLAAAQGIGLAHTAYWLGSVFALGAPPAQPGIGGTGVFSATLSSTVTAAPAASLVTALAALFAAPSADASARAQEVAQAWHTACLQVLVTMSGIDTTPPPAGPLPVVLVAAIR